MVHSSCGARPCKGAVSSGSHVREGRGHSTELQEGGKVVSASREAGPCKGTVQPGSHVREGQGYPTKRGEGDQVFPTRRGAGACSCSEVSGGNDVHTRKDATTEPQTKRAD